MADVSLGSLRRFESSGEVSLKSLVKIAIALGCEQELSSLFSQRQYRSIQEVQAKATPLALRWKQ